MTGGANRADLYVLDSIFKDESNKEIQNKCKAEVLEYECKVQQRAEEIEQASVKTEHAKKLINESEQIRRKR